MKAKIEFVLCRIFICFILVCFFGTAQVSGKSISLNEYLAEVSEANPAIQASKLRALALKYKIRPNATFDDPFIAAGIDEVPFDGGRAKIRRYQISQSIPFPGKIGLKSEIAERRAESSEFDTQTVMRQILVLATQVFLRASYNSQAIILNERIQKILQETMASVKSRYQAGSAGHHEWLLAKLEFSVINVEFLRLKRTKKTLLALLNEMRNMPPDSLIEISYQDLLNAEAQSKVIQADLETQPELRSWKAQKIADEKELKLAKLSYAPDLVIQAMAMTPTMKDDEMAEPANWGVMIGVTIPLFFWRKQSEIIAAAEKDRLATVAEYQSLQNRLNTEIADAQQQLQTSLDLVMLYKKDVIPITEIAVKNARSGYIAKALPMRQLLDALRSQRTQELELFAAQMDIIASRTRIKELLSGPSVIRFAPARPTLFGADMSINMSADDEMDGSTTINMGAGMSGPTRKNKTPPSSDSSKGGMGGM